MKTSYIRTQNDMKKLCFLSTVRIIPIPIASSSPDLSSSLRNRLPGPTLKSHGPVTFFIPKLPLTVTGSYRTYTGFSINPCGTYNDWFKTNKCYLIFTIILQNSFFLLCPVIRKKNQIVFKNIQSDFFIPFTVTDKRIIFILQYYLLKR